MSTKISLEKVITERVCETLMELLGNASGQALIFHLKMTKEIDLKDSRTVTEKPEAVEKAFLDMMGVGGEVILKRINDNLIKVFSVTEAESMEYSKLGDFARLIRQLKTPKLYTMSRSTRIDSSNPHPIHFAKSPYL